MASLATRYRPRSWDVVRGNKTQMEILQQAVKRETAKRPPAFLLTGPSGCGKTTMARLLAKELGCSKGDFIELDSADFRGIDTIRDVRHSASFMPIKGAYRVWLLDECHQLTKDAQEALLKLLEDPPKHAYFVLATTDPDKLKPTLRRRCLEVALSTLSEKSISVLLQEVLEKEGKVVPGEVLSQISRDSLGSPGLALAILDKVTDLPEVEMLKAAKRSAEQQNEAIALARILFKKPKWMEVSKLIKTIEGEPESLRRLVLAYCSSVLLGNDNPQAYVVMDAFRNPFYDDAKAKLIMACYEVVNS